MTERGEQSHEIHEYLYRGYIVDVACAGGEKKGGKKSERRRREPVEPSANAETKCSLFLSLSLIHVCHICRRSQLNPRNLIYYIGR